MLAWKKLTGIALLFLLIAFVAFGIVPASAQAPVATTTTTTTAVNSNTVVTATATLTPTATTVPVSATKTLVPPTATKTKTVAPSATATKTQVPPTATVTKTVVPSATATKPAATATATVTKTATVAPTKTNTPVPPTATSVPKAVAPRAGVVTSLSTMFAVQNTDPSTTANVTATFYDTSGAAVSTVNKTILPYLSTTIDQRAAGGGLDSFTNWQGSVVLSSNTQLAAVVNEYSGNAASQGKDFRYDTYSGVSSTAASTLIVMPQLLKNIFDSGTSTLYNSVIAIQNTGSTTANNVVITYYRQGGTVPIVKPAFSIPANTSVFVDLQTEDILGANFYGSGSISSDQPVAVIVQQNGAGVLNVYQGFTSANAATKLYVPHVVKNIYDSKTLLTYYTSIIVMTMDQTEANVTVTYYDSRTGRVISYTKTANPAATFDSRVGPTSFSYGGLASESNVFAAAVIQANKPIIAVVPFFANYNVSRGLRTHYYRAFPDGQGATKIFLPQSAFDWFDNGSGVTWGTSVLGQLMGSDADVTITYYFASGPSISDTKRITAASPKIVFDQRNDSRLSGKGLFTAVLTSTQPIAAFVETIGSSSTLGDAFGGYEGINQ